MMIYKEDITDTAIATDSQWGGLTSVVESIAKASELLVSGISVSISDTATAFDELMGNSFVLTSDAMSASDFVFGGLLAKSTSNNIAKFSEKLVFKQSFIADDNTLLTEQWVIATSNTINESAVITDSVMGVKHAQIVVENTAMISDYAASFGKELVSDTALASDKTITKSRLKALVSDSSIISDAVSLQQRATILDAVMANDALIGTKKTNIVLSDSAKASDKSITLWDMLSSDSAFIFDSVSSRLKSQSLAVDSAIASDKLVSGKKTNSQVLTDSAAISDTVTGMLLANALWQDSVVIENTLIDNALLFNAWTANTDTWAMSRYSDLPIDRFVVINGNLYGESKNGIYQMDTGTEIVNATIETGKIDFGEALAHPTGAYLEYELNGSASMQVKTTQSGKQQAFRYSLPRERADELTNGRILFGRGLRGRHFTFVLNISATHGYLNSLAINALSTKRRI